MTAAARRPEALDPVRERWESRGALTVVTADVRDPDSVEKAVAGNDAAICAVANTGRDPAGLFSDTARTLVGALERQGARRLVCVTSRGVRHDDRELPLLYRRVIQPLVLHRIYADMRVMEELVRASHLDWALVRPPRLVDGPARGTYRVADAHNPSGGWTLSRADLAGFLLDQLTDTTWMHRAPTLAY